MEYYYCEHHFSFLFYLKRSLLVVLTRHKGLFLSILTILSLAAVFYFIPALPQNPSYNIFADQRKAFEIPNFADVVSNFALVFVGIAGVISLRRPIPTFPNHSERWLYICFFIAVALSGLGSIYYHLDPNNARLVWDRLPISLASMTLLSAIISDRIGPKIGFGSVIPLAALGVMSVLYWQAVDDLRLYGFVLFFPMILIPLLIWLYPTHYTKSSLILQALGWIIVTRIVEFFDIQIYRLTQHLISGHTLKHLISAFAAYLIFRYATNRQLKRRKNL